MVDPNDVINYRRNPAELQEFLLFGIVVAGKTSKVQATKLDKFLAPRRRLKMTPFEYIDHLNREGSLVGAIRKVRLGQYRRLYACFTKVIQINNLKRCSLNDLLKVHGIGPKTARFFLVFTRKDVNHAILDTHILKFMRDYGIPTPRITPTGRKYIRLEREFLKICATQKQQVADFDLSIWKAYSQGNGFEDLKIEAKATK